MRVYICYTQQDLEAAMSIYSLLRDEGIVVFLDKESIEAAEEWQRRIEKEVTNSDVVVLLWSRNAAKSPWVMRELTLALMNHRKIIPCVLDDEPITPLVADRQVLYWDNTDLATNRLKVALGIDTTNIDSTSSKVSLKQAVNTYRIAVRREFGSLRALGQGQDFPIDQIYLPLYLTKEQSDGRRNKPFVVDDLLRLSLKRIIIRGNPGTGKSTITRYLAFNASSDQSPFFPIHIRIAELMTTNDSIIEFATQTIKGLVKKRISEVISNNESYCREGTVLLLDGLDEISERDYQEFIKRLASFKVANPDCKIIITTRYAGFEKNHFNDFQVYDIQELSRVDIERYIWAVCPVDYQERVWTTIRNDSRLFELAKTPFLLAMICATPDALGTRATQRATLFETCTQYLLKQRDYQEPGPGRQRETTEITTILENALKSIAVRFFKLDAKQPFKEDEIIFIIQSMQGSSSTLRPSEILEMICKYSGLLQRAGPAVYFIHRSIWEYFVAKGMRDEPLDNIAERASLSIWEEPIRLFVGLTPERELKIVLGKLWVQNKGLALRAMTELPLFPHDLLIELVNNISRQDRLRLVFQLEENLQAISSELDARRMLLDTVGALVRAEKDCEVIYHCIRLLQRYANQHNCTECMEMINKILDLPNAHKRRHKYLSNVDYKFKLLPIQGGEFVMGTNSRDRTPDEKPEHRVILDSFWIGAYQITNKIYYEEFPYYSSNKRETRSHRDTQPVIYPTWYEAYIFAQWIGCDLPSEAEWEYACRSGGVDDEVLYDYEKIREYAWYIENSDNVTHDVGQLRPNTFGIYDMLGNVREWCKDWFDPDYYNQCFEEGVIVNPQGPDSGIGRKVIRGGCFDWNVANLVPTYRNYNPPDNSYFANGFRVVYRGDDI